MEYGIRILFERYLCLERYVLDRVDGHVTFSDLSGSKNIECRQDEIIWKNMQNFALWEDEVFFKSRTVYLKLQPYNAYLSDQWSTLRYGSNKPHYFRVLLVSNVAKIIYLNFKPIAALRALKQYKSTDQSCICASLHYFHLGLSIFLHIPLLWIQEGYICYREISSWEGSCSFKRTCLSCSIYRIHGDCNHAPFCTAAHRYIKQYYLLYRCCNFE